MRKSIFTRTYVVILCTITAVLILSWLFISFFAEDFYYNNKIRQIEEASKDIQDVLTNRINIQDTADALKKISIRTGADISIYNHYNQLVFADYIMDKERGFRGLFQLRLNPLPSAVFDLRKGQHIILRYTPKSDNTDKYIYGERYNNGILTVIQIPIEAIDETVDIFKEIIQYMMVAALFFGAVGAFILSKNITNPLVELNHIASEMGKLDFSRKYTEKREDEIGQLGQSLNKMADALQSSIRQLQDELKKEKTLDILRKQFVTQVSHEMQTPLTVVQGYVEALEDGLADTEEDRKYHYEVINDEISKMTKMIRELLDLSQLEAGTFKINKEQFNINGLVKKVSDRYNEIAKQKQIIFEYHDVKKAVFVNGDQLRLEQVITNFIKNALEHTGENGKIEVYILLNERKVKVIVKNTGEPIPADDLPYVWESFYKAKINKESKGTGLGLAISKQILNLHNAGYGVDNTEDGTEFWFEMKTI